ALLHSRFDERSGEMTVVVVHPSRSARRPFDARQVELTSGFWADRVQINHKTTIPYGLEQLRSARNLTNLRLAASVGGGVGLGTGAGGSFSGSGLEYRDDLPFLDSDVYKWLEAVGWTADPELASTADEVIELIAAA